MNSQKIISFIKETLVNTVLPQIMAIIYPSQKVFDKVFSMALAAIKYISYDRAKIGSVLFDAYFAEILAAKNLHKSLSLKPNLGEIGAVVETAKLTYAATIVLFGMMYLYLVFAIPAFLYSTMQSIISVKIIVTLAGVMVFYYSGLILFLLIKLFKRQVPQEVIKAYLKEEFTYVYAKAAEIDEECADLTVDYLKSSLLISSDTHYAKHITKLSQKIEEK